MGVFSDGLFVSSYGGGGVGGALDGWWGGRALGNSGMSAQQFGGGWGKKWLGSTVWVSSTSKNRPSHHKYKSPKQFELKQSWKTLRAFNSQWALPVYPVMRTKSQKRQTKNRSSEKIAKKTDRTNLIATKNSSFHCKADMLCFDWKTCMCLLSRLAAL